MGGSAIKDLLAQLERQRDFGTKMKPDRPIRDDGSISAFFYGTLIHPATLKRLIDGGSDHLEICPAVLPGYVRHRVQHANYPGIVPYEGNERLFDRDVPAEDRLVSGVIVRGLTAKEIRLLDIFEGNDYRQEIVSAHPIRHAISLDAAVADEQRSIDTDELSPSELRPPESVLAYVWDAPVDQLEPGTWSHELFEGINCSLTAVHDARIGECP